MFYVLAFIVGGTFGVVLMYLFVMAADKEGCKK
jgi:hypothetical protein